MASKTAKQLITAGNEGRNSAKAYLAHTGITAVPTG